MLSFMFLASPSKSVFKPIILRYHSFVLAATIFHSAFGVAQKSVAKWIITLSFIIEFHEYKTELVMFIQEFVSAKPPVIPPSRRTTFTYLFFFKFSSY